MENYQWRTPARIVAILDIIFTIIALILIAFLIYASLVVTVSVATQTEKVDDADARAAEEGLSAIIVIFWIAIIICVIVIGIDLWSAIMLLKATQYGADPNSALRRAQIWRNVCIVFLILGIIGNLSVTRLITLVISTVVRGIVLFIVCKFIGELRAAIRGELPSPVAVVIKN